jgi:uncharacterized protein YgiM (DUF1202 family)
VRISPLAKFLLPAITAPLLLPISSAQNADTSSAPLWKVTCPGIASVPMTSDAEQAIPLQVVATLKCGEEVTVQDTSGGYTVRVKTEEGQTGYVATMYLRKTQASRRPSRSRSAPLANGVSRWEEGAPGCDQFMNEGRMVESLTVNGITAQVSLHDTGWKLRANVAIANEGSQPISIDPSHFILDEIGAHGRPLFYQDPEELAKNVTHQVLWTQSTAGPADRSMRSSSGSVVTATNVDYRTSVAPTVTAPNYLLQHQSAEDDAVRNQGKQTLVNTAQQIRTLALKPGTVEAGGKVSGSVWFERSKNPQQLMLRIPIDNQMLEFPLSFKPQK